jgi:hypothetical protein
VPLCYVLIKRAAEFCSGRRAVEPESDRGLNSQATGSSVPTFYASSGDETPSFCIVGACQGLPWPKSDHAVTITGKHTNEHIHRASLYNVREA